MSDELPSQMFEKAVEYARLDDWDNAITWYRRAADAGFADAMLVLASIHAARDELWSAQDWLKKGMAASHPHVRETLGVRLKVGIAVHFMKNPEYARIWEHRIRSMDDYPTPHDPEQVRRDAVELAFLFLVDGIEPPNGGKAVSLSEIAGSGVRNAAPSGCLMVVAAIGILPALFAILMAKHGSV
ncbi:hypothetical protein [Kitasatospora sp. NPDC056531]|uniref:hypothetical protein n=1 Tax=Kitasatospora sp. NPDC056531 TaxID=3345856 RepID=UPI0036CDBA3B